MQEPFDTSPLDPEEMKKLRNPEEFAREMSLSSGFARLVIECGCPTLGGKISHEMFMAWLPENFARVRATAGLAPLPALTTARNDKERAELAVDGYLHTIMDFAMSRCSRPELKEAYASIRKQMKERRESEG